MLILVYIARYKPIRKGLINDCANFKDEEVVISKNIVTNREPKDIPAFNRDSLKLLAK